MTALVPAWNAERFIEETLRSLAAQTYGSLRVLVADDASTDATASICERFTARDDRFLFTRRDRNLGWTANTNALLEAADSDYVFFAAHDDVVEPEYVARLVERLESNPGATVAFSDMIELFPDGRRIPRCFKQLDGVETSFERARRILRNDWFWWVPFRGLFRAAAGREIGGLQKHWRGEFGADWPWILGLALRGQFERVAEPLYIKRISAGSLSARWRYSMLDHTAVGWACAEVVERSGLPTLERLRLHGELARRVYRRSAPVLAIARILGMDGDYAHRGRN